MATSTAEIQKLKFHFVAPEYEINKISKNQRFDTFAQLGYVTLTLEMRKKSDLW